MMSRRLRPLNVLIVEDEGILALDLEFLIERCGHAVTGWATCLKEAIQLSRDAPPDLALIDIHLTDGITGVDAATMILQGGCAAVVFMTANPRLIPADFVGAIGVIAKPYSAAGVTAALSYVQEGIVSPPPVLSLPLGFTLSPDYQRLWAV